MNGGIEWIIDAFECRPAALRDRAAVTALLDRVIRDANLHVVAKAEHVFGGPGGVTAMYLLAESHLTIHTFPESGVATINLYCCRPRLALPWHELLAEALGAVRVSVRELTRGGAGLAGSQAADDAAGTPGDRDARDVSSAAAPQAPRKVVGLR
ncbi:MAG: adenosylmethionine decarboxylase [Myxococcales bacterium]|nr:adenosylmethionine decarboxylase [Myxococcales bacterium]